jgi:hypothetical protein
MLDAFEAFDRADYCKLVRLLIMIACRRNKIMSSYSIAYHGMVVILSDFGPEWSPSGGGTA